MGINLEVSRQLLKIPQADLLPLFRYMIGLGRRNRNRVLPGHYDLAVRWVMIDSWITAMIRRATESDSTGAVAALFAGLHFEIQEMRELGQLDHVNAVEMLNNTIYPLLKRKRAKIRNDLIAEMRKITDPKRRRELAMEIREDDLQWLKMLEYFK